MIRKKLLYENTLRGKDADEDTHMHHQEGHARRPLLRGHLPENQSPAEYHQLLYPEHIYGDRKGSKRPYG